MTFDLQFVVHSNLGKVVKEVVEEFRRNPPVPLSSSSTTRYVRPSSPVCVQYYVAVTVHVGKNVSQTKAVLFSLRLNVIG